MVLIFLSHPIQHYVPWFADLHRQLGDDVKVVFATRHGLDESTDEEFGESFAWDMDLLEGYRYEFYPQVSPNLGPNNGLLGIRFQGVEDYLCKKKPDAVMIFGWLFAGYWQVAWAARKLGIPYILRAESNLLNQGNSLKWWVKNQSVGRLCRGAASCLAIGQLNKDLFLAYGVPEERIQLAPYFVDNDLFINESARLKTEYLTLRDHFGLPQDALIFLFMGKLIEKKHPNHLLQARQYLSESLRKRSALLFVGSGALLDELKIQAQGEPRVVFAGFLNRKQLHEAYAVSDVLILPSDEGETWGLVVNEAMASGLPAIVSDRVGCAPDLILEGQTGYSYPFGDITALSDVMARLIENAELISSLGTGAAKHVQMASAKLASETVIKILDTITAKNE